MNGKRTEFIKVYVSVDEKKIIEKKAKDAGVDRSVFLRNLGLTPNMAFDPVIFAEVNENLNNIDKRHPNENTHKDITRIYELLGGTYNGYNENRE